MKYYFYLRLLARLNSNIFGHETRQDNGDSQMNDLILFNSEKGIHCARSSMHKGPLFRHRQPSCSSLQKHKHDKLRIDTRNQYVSLRPRISSTVSIVSILRGKRTVIAYQLKLYQRIFKR